MITHVRTCPVCGTDIWGKGTCYAYSERVCRACYIWSLRARIQYRALGYIRQLAPETLPR